MSLEDKLLDNSPDGEDTTFIRPQQNKEERNQKWYIHFLNNAPPYPDTFTNHWSLKTRAEKVAEWKYAYADAMMKQFKERLPK